MILTRKGNIRAHSLPITHFILAKPVHSWVYQATFEPWMLILKLKPKQWIPKSHTPTFSFLTPQAQTLGIDTIYNKGILQNRVHGFFSKSWLTKTDCGKSNSISTLGSKTDLSPLVMILSNGLNDLQEDPKTCCSLPHW